SLSLHDALPIYEDTIYFISEIADLFDEFVSQSVDEILETAPELFEVRMAADEIFSQTQKLLEETTRLSEQFEQTTQKVYPSTPIGLANCSLNRVVSSSNFRS